MDRFCKNCGKPLKEDQRYCVYCGYDSYQADPTKKEEKDLSASASTPTLGRGEGKKNSLPLMLGISAVLVILIGVGLYFFFGQKGDNAPTTAPASSAAENSPVSEPAAGTATPAETKDFHEQTLGLDYIPAPWLKLHYHELYQDGEEGPYTKYTANLSPKIPVSEASIFVTGNNEEYFSVIHYLIKEDGIYNIDESDLSESLKILPAVIKKGESWSKKFKEGTVEFKVIAVGVNCDLGFTTLKNCVVVERNYKEIGYRIYQYYAPAMGLVKEESPDGNTVYLRVTAYKQIDAEAAMESVAKRAVRLSELEAKL